MSRRSLLVAVLFLATSLAGCADDSPSGSGDGDGMDSTGPSSTDAQRFQSRENVTVGPIPAIGLLGVAAEDNCLFIYPQGPIHVLNGTATIAWNSSLPDQRMALTLVADLGRIRIRSDVGTSPVSMSFESFDSDDAPITFRPDTDSEGGVPYGVYSGEQVTLTVEFTYEGGAPLEARTGWCGEL